MSGAETLTCEYTVTGNRDGATLFFIHGWPDDAGLWDRQVAALAGDHRCVRVTLPNFGAEPVKAGGFNFGELTAMLAATVDEVQPGDAPVTLITHDWGAYLGFLLEQAHPGRVERMIAMDIGGHVRPAPRETLFIVAYQWTLILLWLVGGLVPPLGNALTAWFAGKLGVPAPRIGSVRSRFNYMYFYLWRGMLLPWWGRDLLARYRPQCPVWFAWGRKKPVMFHSARWLELVERSGGRHAGIDGAGHWFMLSHAEETNRLLREWLSSPADPDSRPPSP